MQFEIRHINTTIRPLERPSDSAQVELEELARLVGTQLEQARSESEGRSLVSDGPAGERPARS